MKRLELTPELQQLIKDRVGPDTNLDGIAVFETITLNDKPLVGKKGTIWEGAKATPLTLKQISDAILGGNTMPLQLNHSMAEMPVGRVFDAGLDYSSDGSFELRTLFYTDGSPDGQELATKIDNSSIDEVSISFLPTSYLCSDCGFDYLGPDATMVNLITRTCGDGHEVGTDGVHVSMVGLANLIELSLVARGAAANPKIVGRSASKLAPASAQRLAARGFEIEGLVCQASRGEEQVDTAKLVADLMTATSDLATLKATVTQHEAALTAATERATGFETQLTAANEQIATLTTERDDAVAANRTADADAAITWLTASLTKLYTAAGKAIENLPTDVAALTAAIDAETKGLTALIPAGGRSQSGNSGSSEGKPAAEASLSAFKTNRN